MSADRYTKTAITLHWVIAFLIIGQLGTGIVMGYKLVDKSILFPLFQFHKSLGLTILVLSLVRLLWRVTHKAPPLPDHMPIWEKLAAKASHYAFYLFMIGVPLSGWLLVSSSSMGFPTSYFNLFIWPHIPGIETLPDAQKEQVNNIAYTVHVYLAYSTLALLGLHIAAALKHQFIDKDNVMHHMIPWIRPKLPLALILITLLSLPVHAANWEVDHVKSEIAFQGQNSGETFDGKFLDWTADINFDPAKPEGAKILVTIKTASAKTQNLTYNMTLPKDEWFDAAKHPDAVFKADTVKSLGADKYEAIGKLTIKNITHDLTLPFTLKIDGKTALMTADLKINRLDFDIGKKSDPQADWVSKDITLAIKVAADEK